MPPPHPTSLPSKQLGAFWKYGEHKTRARRRRQGMEPHQQDNLLQTLLNNARERVKILVGFIQFVSMVLSDVAKVALQAEEMLKDGTIQEVGADEGVSFVQRPILEALGVSQGKTSAADEKKLELVADALRVTLQRLPEAAAARRARGLNERLEHFLASSPTSKACWWRTRCRPTAR